MSVEEMLEYISKFRSDDRCSPSPSCSATASAWRQIYELTQINPYFLGAIKNIVDMEETLKLHVERPGISAQGQGHGLQRQIHRPSLEGNRAGRVQCPKSKRHFPCFTGWWTPATPERYIPYFYSSYTGTNDSRLTDRKKIVVLGAGPIRIGQGVEFDYSTVHAVMTIQQGWL